MHFKKTSLLGLYILEPSPLSDERGFFARTFCKREFESQGLKSEFVQCNISYNHKEGTLRGLHYQQSPHEETKIVTCRRGRIYDVIVDIRPRSPTLGKWIGIELSADNLQGVYIPEGFAHGFQTLTNDAEVSYLMGNYFNAEAATGIRYDDPHLNISWPNPKMIISQKDRNLPLFNL
ncbi:MAG: dTDP-4-dehydrorhamnose 3,5-epimerase [Gammaproteobacteria bacterium]|nr:dTDP-4-dehydrorhamnose 3,5-epimerase [Gammaproteobacteria bacterium]